MNIPSSQTHTTTVLFSPAMPITPDNIHLHLFGSATAYSARYEPDVTTPEEAGESLWRSDRVMVPGVCTSARPTYSDFRQLYHTVRIALELLKAGQTTLRDFGVLVELEASAFRRALLWHPSVPEPVILHFLRRAAADPDVLLTRTNWLEDLTRYGIERNPGPGAMYANTLVTPASTSGILLNPFSINDPFVVGDRVTIGWRILSYGDASTVGYALIFGNGQRFSFSGGPTDAAMAFLNGNRVLDGLWGADMSVSGTATLQIQSTSDRLFWYSSATGAARVRFTVWLSSAHSDHQSVTVVGTVPVSSASPLQVVGASPLAVVSGPTPVNITGPVAINNVPEVVVVNDDTQRVPVSLPTGGGGNEVVVATGATPLWTAPVSYAAPAPPLVGVEPNPGPSIARQPDTVVLTVSATSGYAVLYVATETVQVHATISACCSGSADGPIVSSVEFVRVPSGYVPPTIGWDMSTTIAPAQSLASELWYSAGFYTGPGSQHNIGYLTLNPGDELGAVVSPKLGTGTWYIKLRLVGIETNPGPLTMRSMEMPDGSTLTLCMFRSRTKEWWAWVPAEFGCGEYVLDGEKYANVPFHEAREPPTPVAPGEPWFVVTAKGKEREAAQGVKQRYRVREKLDMLVSTVRPGSSSHNRAATRDLVASAVFFRYPAAVLRECADTDPEIFDADALASMELDTAARVSAAEDAKRVQRKVERADRPTREKQEPRECGGAASIRPQGREKVKAFRPDEAAADRRRRAAAIRARVVNAKSWTSVFIALAKTEMPTDATTLAAFAEMYLGREKPTNALDQSFLQYCLGADPSNAAHPSCFDHLLHAMHEDDVLAQTFSDDCVRERALPCDPISLLAALADSHNQEMHAKNGNIDRGYAVLEAAVKSGPTESRMPIPPGPSASMFRNWAATQSTKPYIHSETSYLHGLDVVESQLASGKITYAAGVANYTTWRVAHAVLPNLASNGAYVTSATFKRLTSELSVGNTLEGSALVKIKTEQYVGQNLMAVARVAGHRYASGITGSMAAPLLRNLLSVAARAPLLGPEGTFAGGNTHTRLTAPPVLTYGNVFFPLAPNEGLPAPVVNATVCTLTQFNRLRAGTGTAFLAEYGPETWGTTCALVPVTTAMLNSPEAAAAWTLMFMEYPFRQTSWQVEETTGDGTAVGAAYNAETSASRTRVQGPSMNVLYVLTDVLRTGGDQQGVLQLRGLTVTTTTESAIGGVPINVFPALSASTASWDPYNQGLLMAQKWWFDRCSRGDYVSALLAAADAAHLIGAPGVWDPNSTISAGTYIFNGDQIPAAYWDRTGYTTVDKTGDPDPATRAAHGQSHPWSIPVITTFDDEGTFPKVARIGALDGEACVDLYCRVLMTEDPADLRRVPTTMAGWADLFRRVSQGQTAIAEILLRQMGVGYNTAIAIEGPNGRAGKREWWNHFYSHINKVAARVGADALHYTADGMVEYSTAFSQRVLTAMAGTPAAPGFTEQVGGRVPLPLLEWYGAVEQSEVPSNWATRPFASFSAVTRVGDPTIYDTVIKQEVPMPRESTELQFLEYTSLVQVALPRDIPIMDTCTESGSIMRTTFYPVSVPDASRGRPRTMENYDPAVRVGGVDLFDVPFMPGVARFDATTRNNLYLAFMGRDAGRFVRTAVYVGRRTLPIMSDDRLQVTTLWSDSKNTQYNRLQGLNEEVKPSEEATEPFRPEPAPAAAGDPPAGQAE